MGDNKRSAIVLLAEGAEEMETVITVDVLRRGGIDVTLAGIAGNEAVKCSRGVCIKPDKSLSGALDGTEYDVVILPGGLGGAKLLASSEDVGKLLQKQEKRGAIVAAICAGPTAFVAHKIAIGKNITSYPKMADHFKDSYNYKEDRVVTDGNTITSRGPGTCFEFALELVKVLVNEDKAREVSAGMLLE